MPVVSVGRSDYAGSKLSIVMEIVGPSLMLLLSWPLSRVADRKNVLLLVNWWTGEIVIVGTLIMIHIQCVTDPLF